MAYATPADVARVATRGWDDIAQRAVQNARVPGETLRALYSGESVAGVAADVLELAQRGLALVADTLERASRHADTYLFPRYRASMPLPTDMVLGSSLPGAVAAIALKRLYGTLVPEELRRGAAWADQYLVDLSKGVVSLGGADTDVAQPAGRVVTRTPSSTFDWRGY